MKPVEQRRSGCGVVARAAWPALPALLVLLLGGGLAPGVDRAGGDPAEGDSTPAPPAPLFTAETIPGFLHSSGATGRRYLVETMGSGLAWVDLDRDGDLDLLLLDGGPLESEPRRTAAPRSRLLRNDGRGGFTDVTDESGIVLPDYAMGCAVGDVDGDGDPDLFVSCFGRDRLLLNEGGLRFRDGTEAAGLGDEGWGASAAFADLDGDGDLDLFVTRYLDFTVATHRECSLGRGIPTYCSPAAYDGVPDLLYRNDGAGRFEEVGATVGVGARSGRGLGVWLGDLDGDLDVDIYVANDGEENALFRNRGDGTFEDDSLISGAGYDANGAAEAGMGIAAGDVDGDARVDLLVTHLSSETNTLYLAEGGGFYRDATRARGLAAPSLPMTGFGTALADFDRDGHLDLVVANGHVIDNIHEFGDLFDYRQRDQLFRGGPTRFEEPAGWLSGDLLPGVGRGLAVGDADGDGDLDWLVSQCDGPAVLYRSNGAGAGHWLTIRLEARGLGRVVAGARVEVHGERRRWVHALGSGGSYLTATEPEATFGLGADPGPVTVIVHWPDGSRVERAAVEVDRVLVLTGPDAAGPR